MPDENEKDKSVEHFRWLADGATARYFNRREIEWKLYYSIWAAYGGAIYLIYSGKKELSWLHFALVCILGLVPIVAMIRFWIPWIQQKQVLDQRIDYYWRSVVELKLGTEIPSCYRPRRAGTEWIRAKKNPDGSIEPSETKYEEPKFAQLLAHKNFKAVIVVTLSFYLLLLGAAVAKVKSAVSQDDSPGLSIEKLESDGNVNFGFTTSEQPTSGTGNPPASASSPTPSSGGTPPKTPTNP